MPLSSFVIELRGLCVFSMKGYAVRSDISQFIQQTFVIAKNQSSNPTTDYPILRNHHTLFLMSHAILEMKEEIWAS